VAQGLVTRQVGGFVARVPDNRTAPPLEPGERPLPPGHRRIPLNPAYTILSQLRPEDQVLEVVSGGSSFVDGHDIPEVEIAGITMSADAVALLCVTAKEGALTKDGKYVRSTVTVEIEDILKDATRHLVAGQTTIIEPGGSVLIGKQQIIAYQLRIASTEVGHRYLAALALNMDTGEWFIERTSSFEVKGQTIKRLRRDASPKWTLDRKSLDWVTGQVRKNAHLRRPQR
jgi:hypothetical protein